MKMKLFIILAVGAQAWTCRDSDPQPCTFEDWLPENWWASVDESYNFLSNNWEQFIHAIPSVRVLPKKE